VAVRVRTLEGVVMPTRSCSESAIQLVHRLVVPHARREEVGDEIQERHAGREERVFMTAGHKEVGS
jgi:hypothetical protein